MHDDTDWRSDAIKHIDEGFIADFVKHVREKVDNPDLFCVGGTSPPSVARLTKFAEFWKDSLGALEGYLDRCDTQFSIFDTPLHYNFKEAGDAGEGYDLRKIFDGSCVAPLFELR